MKIAATIRKTIDAYNLIPEGAKVVAGVSGGADSVALLRSFHQLGIGCTVAHLNHQLRGEASDADEQFVRELAQELGLPLVVKHANVRSRAKEYGLSIEMAARQARHDFFSEFKDSVIALAHHADDQVETFILKLARGAGSDGLGGMSYLQVLGDLRIIRPMLDITRTELLRWLEENRFEWREDASNADEQFLRNRIRHTVLPMLADELNPNIRETILRTMDILRAENDWMTAQLEGLSPADKLPLAAKRRILRQWLFDQGATEVDFDAVENILSLMERKEGSRTFELNDRQRIVVEYGTPRFEYAERAFPSAQTWQLTTEHGSGWRKDHGTGAGILPAEASFDADKVGDASIEVRAWRPGDRMKPLGIEGSRKLQDILTDQKIPRAQRTAIPVVVCRGEIIWLPGYRTARDWEVQGERGKALHVRIE